MKVFLDIKSVTLSTCCGTLHGRHIRPCSKHTFVAFIYRKSKGPVCLIVWFCICRPVKQRHYSCGLDLECGHVGILPCENDIWHVCDESIHHLVITIHQLHQYQFKSNLHVAVQELHSKTNCVKAQLWTVNCVCSCGDKFELWDLMQESLEKGSTSRLSCFYSKCMPSIYFIYLHILFLNKLSYVLLSELPRSSEGKW